MYIGHRSILPMNDPMRESKWFENYVEVRSSLRQYSGDDVLRKLEHLHPRLPRKHKEYRGVKCKLNWSKNTIIFQLEYWHHLLLRHNLDVMDIEKNVCDSVLSTLLSINENWKIKKARLDLVDIKIWKVLHLYKVSNRWTKLNAAYTLIVDERKKLCQFIKSMKLSRRIYCQLSKNVSEIDSKIFRFKSHDCHMLFEQLLHARTWPFMKKEIHETIIDCVIISNEYAQKPCMRMISKILRSIL